MSDSEKSSSGFGKQGVTFVAILLVCFAFLFALWISARTPKTTAIDQKRVEERAKILADTRAAQKALISDYAWANKDEKVVRIPIERAMELVVSEYEGK